MWRFHTLARPGEPGGNTWNDLPLDKRTGGSVWDQGTYDKDLNLIYYGAGPTYDTGPLLKPSSAPGVTNDALYTNATIALDANTGQLKWHYQHLRNDQWDLDWAFERTLATVRIDGQNRRVVMNVGKMGILDGLDAATGAYLFSIDAGTQNIITAIDPRTGEKTIDPQRLPDPDALDGLLPEPVRRARMAADIVQSGHGPALPAADGVVHQIRHAGLAASKCCRRAAVQCGSPGCAGGRQDGPAAGHGCQRASKLAWRHDLEAPISTSALSTAGGVVFAGDLDPALKAFDDRDGKLLWSAPLDANPSSSVITYSVGAKQYVAVVTGMGNYHIGAMSGALSGIPQSRGLARQPPTGAPVHPGVRAGRAVTSSPRQTGVEKEGTDMNAGKLGLGFGGAVLAMAMQSCALDGEPAAPATPATPEALARKHASGHVRHAAKRRRRATGCSGAVPTTDRISARSTASTATM